MAEPTQFFARPPRLRPGMLMGIVAPSGPLGPNADLDDDVAALERLGFQAVLGEHIHDHYGYLAGQDRDRADDLLTMLEREDIDAVMCMGGGYGAHRTVAALDMERLYGLRAGPIKPFIGYSDITVIHALLQREVGWGTFYGPMLRGFAKISPFTRATWRAALMDGAAVTIGRGPEGPDLDTIAPGKAEGQLLGGCLSLVASLVGTPWELDLRGAIFCFEDIHEQPYRVDRMLTHMLLAGKLQGCAGIAIGEHVECEPRDPERSLALRQIFVDLLRPLNIPVLYGLPIGHGSHLATVPLGRRAELDATAGTLHVLEPGVE